MLKNIILDLNILLDYYEEERMVSFPDSIQAFERLKNANNAFISSSSLDNFEYIKSSYLKLQYPNLNQKQRLKITHNIVKEITTFFKLAKTPSYIDIDYDDIEDSQVIASAKAIDAKVLTRDEKMLLKYPEFTISPKDFLSQENSQNIDFANLKFQHFLYQDEFEKEIDQVLNNTNFIMGNQINELELNLQNYTKSKFAISCASGTDALLLALLSLDIKPNDEVITTPFTFIATAEMIALLGAKPVFVDIDEQTYNIDESKIEEKITPKTKAIIAVSLYGQPSNLGEISKICQKQGIKLIIDGAQSFGATYKGISDSALGDISITSFFPAKPLGCYGDGGAVFTQDESLALKIQSLRLHGQSKRYHHQYIGIGGRLDTIQAAVLNVKLKHYEKDLKLRQDVAEKYTNLIQNKDIILPYIAPNSTSAWAQYSIRVKNRNELQAKLTAGKIPTAIHYPMPLHLQECFKYLGYKKGDFKVAEMVSNEILSLPMNPYLSDEELGFISKSL